MYRVLKPYVDEAYRIVQRDYLDPSPGKRSSASSKSLRGGSPSNTVFHTPPSAKLNKSSLGWGQIFPETPLTLKPIVPSDTYVGRAQVLTPQSLPSESIGPSHHPELPPEFLAPPSYSPPMQPTSPQFSPSMTAEGHLPLLNQVLQNAKRWIDWDYQLDPKSPTTTPIWDSSGNMSGVLVCKGRGNTKKLAKNDAARTLVSELQDRLGHNGATTPELAQELERWYLEKQVCPMSSI